MSDLAMQFVEFMGRHLVALQIDGEYNDGKNCRPYSQAVSGFILEIEGNWYWTTAGHCLKEVDRCISKGYLRDYGSGFVDYFGPGARDVQALPFTYEVECGLYIYDTGSGLDFGVIPLSYLLVRNMLANGIVPISRSNWHYPPTLVFEAYKMLGFPAELLAKRGGYVPLMIHIDRIDPRELDNPPSSDRFVGRVELDNTIDDIRGMSGGPIFGFRRDDNGDWRYNVVALQSSWRKRDRVIFGCSVPMVAERLHIALTCRESGAGDRLETNLPEPD